MQTLTSDNSSGCIANEVESEKVVEEGTGASESAKRRLAHLVKLGEQMEAEGTHMRNFLITQGAKVS